MSRCNGFAAVTTLAILLLSGSGVWAETEKLRLKKVEIFDAQGFERPMTALTLLIPVDWRAQGGVSWNPGAVVLDFRARPDLRADLKAYNQTTPMPMGDMRKIAGIQAKGISNRAAITSKANAEISQIIREGEEYRQRVMDKSHEKWSRVIREVEVYDDPLEGRIELPNTYDRAFRLGDGSYWMTNDPNFDPYQNLGLNGTELNRIE